MMDAVRSIMTDGKAAVTVGVIMYHKKKTGPVHRSSDQHHTSQTLKHAAMLSVTLGRNEGSYNRRKWAR
jgi:hypothetical protein